MMSGNLLSCNNRSIRYPALRDDTVFNIHIQWFAAEDEGRTEDPTEHKIRKARQEGNVAKSSDVTSALVMIFGLIALILLSGNTVQIIIDMMRHFISLANPEPLNSNRAIVSFGNYILRLILPFMSVCFIAAFLGNVMQVGFLFSTKPITPDFSRIQPNLAKWAQKSFFSTEAIFNLFKSIFKVLIIALLAYFNIKSEIPRLTNSIGMMPFRSLILVSGIAVRLMLEAAILLLLFAIPDFMFQRNKHRESLKMSRQEVKDEYKRMEGDPMIKSRLRQRMQELLSSSIAKTVPEADVVITNPTHYSVAIKWDSATMLSPRVTAKGIDEVALRIREMARKSDVPIVENRPLARVLYSNVEVGDEIPEEYWDVVSIVLSEVYRLAGRVV